MNSEASMQTPEDEHEVSDQAAVPTAKSNNLPSMDEGTELPISKPFAVVIPFVSPAQRLEKPLVSRSRRPMRANDLGRYIHKMPNDILVQVFEHLPAGGKELETIRLLSKSFAALAKPAYFRAVALPMNLDRLRTAVDVLTREDISRYIREIRIYAQAMIPRKQLDETRIMNPDSDIPENKHKFPTWSSRFTVQLMRVFLATSQKLQAIRLDGISPMSATQSVMFLDKAFANCVADLLCTINFPGLQTLHFKFMDISMISKFFTIYTRSSATTFDANMGHLQALIYQSNTDWVDDMDQRFISWLSQLPAIKRLSLSMGKDGGLGKILLAPLINTRTLKILRLRYMVLQDSLSAVLSSLDLQSVEFHFIKLNSRRDRWDCVCEVLMAMTRLWEIKMNFLDYLDTESCTDDGLCSPYMSDRRAYDKLKAWARALHKEGRMHCPWDSLSVTCNCLDKVIYILSDSDDDLNDL